MIPRSNTKLTIYRRHAKKQCPLTDIHKLDSCQCPLWVHGKVRGKFIRESLDTRSMGFALIKRKELISREGGDDDPTPGGVHVINAPKGDVTVKAALDDFLLSKTQKATRTKLVYDGLRHFQLFLEGQDVALLRDIDKTHIAAYLNEYSAKHKRSTVKNRLVAIRCWMKYCIRERRWLEHSPAASHDLNVKLTKTERMPFTPGEVTRILAAIELMPEEDRDRARALILLLLFSGMRISDATFIERGYIDSLNGLCYWIIKTGKELPCSIELHAKAIAALNALPDSRVYFFQPDAEGDYREARNALRNGGKFDEAMPGYLTRVQNATRLVRRVLKLAGLTGSCHRFRDTFAVTMLQGGEDLYVVCEFLGHSDVAITRDHYVKFVPGYRERFAQRARALDYQFPLAG